MIETYSRVDPERLLHVTYDIKDVVIDREDISIETDSLQCAAMSAEAGKKYTPHRHLVKLRGLVKIQEAFICISGKLRVHIYDIDNQLIESVPLRDGQIAILFDGGHSLEAVEGSTFYEIKTGPYQGQGKDKVFI